MDEQSIPYNHAWPQHFLADFERIGSALWFFLYLQTRKDPQTSQVRGSFRKIAADVGVDAATLKGWLEQLEKEGYLRDESLDGKLIVRLVR